MVHLQLRAQSMALEKQLNDAKKDSQQMVAALQQNMSEKVTDLRDELTNAQLQCQRMMSWGVRVMGSRHTSILLREAWAAWKKLTWQGGDRQTRECKIQQLAVRFLRFRSYRAFNTWWEIVNVTKHARQQAEKAYRRLMHQQLAACFGAWQDAVTVGAHTLERAVSSMQSRQLRAVMRQWAIYVHDSRNREQVCCWMAARARRRQVACIFRLWHQLLRDAQAAADQMSMRLQQKLLAAAFAAWYSAAIGGSTSGPGIRGLDDHVLAARICKRICRGAFGEWRRNAARRARNRDIVVRRYDVLASRLQSCVLVEWWSTALRRRRGRRIVERCCLQRRHQCMRAVLDAWCGVKEGGHAPLDQLEQSLHRRCGFLYNLIQFEHCCLSVLIPPLCYVNLKLPVRVWEAALSMGAWEIVFLPLTTGRAV